jgi:hypothetical protein
MRAIRGDGMETSKSRLRKLAESNKYKKDFEEVKNSILASEEIDGKIYTYWSGKRSRVWFRELVDHVDGIIWSGNPSLFTLKKVQGLLKKGNLNNHYLTIPPIYSDFKTKYKLEYFFDPGRAYPQAFDPFHDIPVMVHSAADGRLYAPFLPDPAKDPDATKILMYIDITYPLSVLGKQVMAELRYVKKIWGLRQKRKERYPDYPTYHQVKRLMEKGMKCVEIFKQLHPEYRHFNFTKDYVTNPEKTQFHHAAWKAYKKIERLMERVESRKR